MAVTAPRAAKKNSLRNQQPEFLPFRRSLWLWKGLARQKPERCGDLFTFYLQSAWGISPYCFLTLRKWRRESSKRERKKKTQLSGILFMRCCALPAPSKHSHKPSRATCVMSVLTHLQALAGLLLLSPSQGSNASQLLLLTSSKTTLQKFSFLIWQSLIVKLFLL